MNAREFGKLLARDGYCLACGNDGDTVTVQHRINRQMGGAGTHSKRNRPSNLVVLCSDYNQRMESDADVAQEARARGYKLESWQDPEMVPVWDAVRSRWFYLDNNYGSFEALDWDELP